MPRPTRSDDLLAFFVDRLAEAVVARMGGPRAAASTGSGTRKGRARRKIDMRCRFPNCKTRSKGPRFRFLCEEHLKLPKKAQNAAIAEAAAAR
jgi:hypothetical protein